MIKWNSLSQQLTIKDAGRKTRPCNRFSRGDWSVFHTKISFCKHVHQKYLFQIRELNSYIQVVAKNYQRMKTRHSTTSAYALQTNGVAERFNQTFINKLARSSEFYTSTGFSMYNLLYFLLTLQSWWNEVYLNKSFFVAEFPMIFL